MGVTCEVLNEMFNILMYAKKKKKSWHRIMIYKSKEYNCG